MRYIIIAPLILASIVSAALTITEPFRTLTPLLWILNCYLSLVHARSYRITLPSPGPVGQRSMLYIGVAQSLNTLAWDGTDPTEFSVFLANSDSNVLTSMLALASIVPTYQTSLTINPSMPSPGPNIALAEL